MKHFNELKYRVASIVKEQNDWRGSTLNMIASENIASPLARSLIDSDFNHRYAEGGIGCREYQGAKFIDELETIVVGLSKQLFNCSFVEHRAISGALANMAIYYGLAKPGQKVFTLSVPEGAHISFREFGTAGARGLQVLDIPFDTERMNIDLEKFIMAIEKEKPQLITLGGSLFLFPHPVREIKKACASLDTRIHYDGAHVLGLIAGKQFQDPLAEGADVLDGSTHKTFPGPQGALIMTNEEKVYKKVNRAIFPGLVSNHHLGRMAPLAITLMETLEFGEAYALQIVNNAQHLGKVLDDSGLDVLAKNHGYTRSHQVIINVSKVGGGAFVARALEEANIIANKNLIPCDDQSCVHDPTGLRLGVQELTRYGMKEPQMDVVGSLIADVLLKKDSTDGIKTRVTKLHSDFTTPAYCYKV